MKKTRISFRYATEEDYKKQGFYSVGPLHRASPSTKTDASDGTEKAKDEPDTSRPLDLQNLPVDPADATGSCSLDECDNDAKE